MRRLLKHVEAFSGGLSRKCKGNGSLPLREPQRAKYSCEIGQKRDLRFTGICRLGSSKLYTNEL